MSKYLEIYPNSARHNDFWREVQESIDVQNVEVPYDTAYEVRVAVATIEKIQQMEKSAHARGWATRREGEDYQR